VQSRQLGQVAREIGQRAVAGIYQRAGGGPADAHTVELRAAIEHGTTVQMPTGTMNVTPSDCVDGETGEQSRPSTTEGVACTSSSR
jgi:hypothetical protein